MSSGRVVPKILVVGILLTVVLGAVSSLTAAVPPAPRSAEPPLPVRVYEFPQISDFKHLWQPSFATLAGSEDTSKIIAHDVGTYLALPEVFEEPITVAVYTEGEPAEYESAPTTQQVASGEKTWITLNLGTTATAEQLEELQKLGEFRYVSPLTSLVLIDVTNKDDIRTIKALPYVFLIMIYGPNGGPLQTFGHDPVDETYTIDWLRVQQNADDARAKRDLYDGTGDGSMPRGVRFHVIDTGYDATETRFASAWAQPLISTHQMDWTVSPATDAHQGNIAAGTNRHGTEVADILALQNYLNGLLVIHRVHSLADLREALEHINADHDAAHVISTSVGRYHWEYSDNYPIDTCRGTLDDVLQGLMNKNIYTSAAIGNPRDDPAVHDWSYPATSTFVAGVAGAQDITDSTEWYNWFNRTNNEFTPTGFIDLDPYACPFQHAFHADRDRSERIYKPDVFAFHVVNTLQANHHNYITGTSYAQPQVASNLGNIHARHVLPQMTTVVPFKSWNEADGCWAGVYKLMWFYSQAPGLSDVLPDSQRGAINDQLQWWEAQPGCGGLSYEIFLPPILP